jgi:uncharacterized protein
MNRLIILLALYASAFYVSSCNNSPGKKDDTAVSNPAIDHDLAYFISHIKAVDNHAHPNTMEAIDSGFDALPLDTLGNIELPARVRPGSPSWLEAYKAVYRCTTDSLGAKELKDLADTVSNLKKQIAEKFPAWALDQAGIDLMLANRIYMGQGISSPRFQWVAYADALLFPFPTDNESLGNPDREKLFPIENKLMKKFLRDLHLTHIPATLDGFLKQVVTATLESMKAGGCLALKFEAAYLRSLDFEKVTFAAANEIYGQSIHGARPAHPAYKSLQDYIFRYIAQEAGRLHLAVHVHSFPGAGDHFVAADADPLLLEPVFNDPSLSQTKFVLIHGGGIFYKHTVAMLWKPNVYADISLLTLLWSPAQLALVLRDWLSQFPEKVLFGTDADAFGPGLGWELSAWIASHTAREALGIALTGMIQDGEINFNRAKEIAVMVMRTNAANLYGLHLP